MPNQLDSSFNHQLAQHHTLALPLYADQLVTISRIPELLSSCREAQRRGSPLLPLGEGSNVLFCDHFKGTVMLMRIGGVNISETAENWHLHVGSGYNWHQLVCYTLELGMAGLENLALIPGCVGAAPIHNIGAYGVEFKRYCEYVELLDPKTESITRLPAAECHFSYRDSIFKHKQMEGFIITAVGLKIAKRWQAVLSYNGLNCLKQDEVTSHQIFTRVCELRCQKIPDHREIGNAGSFFKNPVVDTAKLEMLLPRYPEIPFHQLSEQKVKIPAAWLIERAGLKGHYIGNAAVSQLHALVLTNLGGATHLEMLALAKEVYQRVNNFFQISLTPEVCFIGSNGKVDPLLLLE